MTRCQVISEKKGLIQLLSDATVTTVPFNGKRFCVKTTDLDTSDRTVQALYDGDTDEEVYFVQDLYDCPEDAVVGRNLIDAYQLIAFINYGIELGMKGYTSAFITDTIVVDENEIW